LQQALFTAVGIFVLAAAALNWSFFMEHRKAQFVVGLIGRSGARVLYGLLGIAFIALGVAVSK